MHDYIESVHKGLEIWPTYRQTKYVLTGTEVGTLDVAELCKPCSIVYYNIE